jgi:hypothetical protein
MCPAKRRPQQGLPAHEFSPDIVWMKAMLRFSIPHPEQKSNGTMPARSDQYLTVGLGLRF